MVETDSLRREPGSSEDRPIVVFGTGRSGTTWLAEIIAGAGCRFVFEPMHPVRVPDAGGFPFPHYLLPGDDSPWAMFLARVVAGDVMNEFTLRENPDVIRPVVKLIRANLMMEWLMDRFDFHPVFMVRNPLAVVGSMKEQEWNVSADYVRHAMREVSARDGTYEGFDDLFEQPLNPIEAYAAYWANQTYVLKARGLLDRVHSVRFEELVRKPDQVITPLFQSIGLTVTEEVRRRFGTLSHQRGKQSWQPGYDPIRAWKRSLAPMEIDQVCRIVRRFDLEEYLSTD